MWILSKPYTIFERMLGHTLLSPDVQEFVKNEHSKPSRLYHGVYHLAFIWHMHETLAQDEFRSAAIDQRIACATAMHDIVYNAQSKTNELDSSLQWGRFPKEIDNFGAGIVGWTHDAIMATADHLRPRPVTTVYDNVREWFVGLDLVSLAAPWDIFLYNNKLLRLEYCHLTDTQWNDGQKAFLSAFLEKRIYHHSLLHSMFETDAKANIAKLIS